MKRLGVTLACMSLALSGFVAHAKAQNFLSVCFGLAPLQPEVVLAQIEALRDNPDMDATGLLLCEIEAHKALDEWAFVSRSYEWLLQRAEDETARVNYRILLAESWWRAGELDRALTRVEEALARAPRQADGWYLYALILWDQDTVSDALIALDTSLGLDPTGIAPRLTRAHWRYLGGQDELALADLDRLEGRTLAPEEAQQVLRLRRLLGASLN